MKLVWFGIILITTVLVLGMYLSYDLYSLSLLPEGQKENFQNPTSEELTKLNIQTCPASSISYINDKGNTICCDGSLIDGKCSGKDICTLSSTAKGIPTCSTWYQAYLDVRGNERCPKSLPNYYEDNGKSVKGCTSDSLNMTGTAPASSSSGTTKKCILYTLQKDEEFKMDSCSNVKMLEDSFCFSRAVAGEKKALFKTSAQTPPLVQCTTFDTLNKTPLACFTDESLIQGYKKTFNTNDIASINSKLKDSDKINFCSIYQQIFIDKTKGLKDISKLRTRVTN